MKTVHLGGAASALRAQLRHVPKKKFYPSPTTQVDEIFQYGQFYPPSGHQRALQRRLP
jgi:hypothetical protein